MILTLLVVLVVATAVAMRIRIRKNTPEWKKPDYFNVFMLIVWSTAALLIFLTVCAMSWSGDEGESPQADTWTVDIVAMGNSEQTSGEYRGGVFASYGHLDSEQVINYVTRDEQGGLHLDRVPANTTTVYEQDGTPRLVKTSYTEHVDYSFWVPWMVGERKGNAHTDLYVPKGSVVSEFSLDTTR